MFEPTEVNVSLNTEVLKRLLATHTLHAEDLHCADNRSKRALSRLLLSLVLDEQGARRDANAPRPCE